MARNSTTRHEVQVNISSVLVTRPEAATHGVSLTLLASDYREQTGSNVPFRLLGYPTFLDYLQSIPNVVSVQKRPYGFVVIPVKNEKIQHVSELVAAQNRNRNSRRGGRAGSNGYGRFTIRPAVSRLYERSEREQSRNYYYNVNDNKRQLPVRMPEDSETEANDYSSDDFPRSLSTERPVGNNPDTDKSLNNFSSSPQSNGFPEEPANENANENDCNGVSEEITPTIISERVKIRLDKLILARPEGIWCAELPELYFKEYTIPLNYEELGFQSVCDFAAHLPDIFQCVQPKEMGDFKLYHVTATKPDFKVSKRPPMPSLASLHNIYEQHVEPTQAIPSVLPPEMLERLIPDGVMTVGETVGQICITELNRGVNDYFDVVVVDVYTPSFFWIHLLNRRQKFDQLMADLHTFYTANDKKYVMPIVVMEKGLNCACQYDNRWHRAIIKSVLPTQEVTVMFYDYGTVQSYPAECIFFLHRSFSNLPAQAIPCGLYNVKPVNSTRWTRSVSCEFAAVATNIPLVATIGSIDTDNNSMLIGLTNTQDTEDFYINDWMVQSGFAVYGKMVCIRPPNYPYRRFLECNNGNTSSVGKLSSSSKKPKTDKLNENKMIALPSDETGIRFYNILRKLHLESRAGKNLLVPLVDKDNSIKKRDGDFSNDVQSQLGRNNVKSKTADEKMKETQCSREFIDNNDVNILRLENDNHIQSIDNGLFTVSNNPSSSSLRESRSAKKHSDRKIRSIHEKEIIERKETSIINKYFDDYDPNLPLHLRPPKIIEATDGDENCEEFGTMHSRLGGHGRMEPIDWSIFKAEGQESTRVNTVLPTIVETAEKAKLKRITSKNDAGEKLCSKLPPGKRALFDMVMRKLKSSTGQYNIDCFAEDDSFGKFHDLYGGNGRSESVEWSKALQNNRNSEKNLEQSEEKSKSKDQLPKTEFNAPRAKNSFLQIVRNVVLKESTDGHSFFTPKGNITEKQEITPKLRFRLKRLEKENKEDLRVFIPDEILGYMENDIVESHEPISENPLEQSNISKNLENGKTEKIRKSKHDLLTDVTMPYGSDISSFDQYSSDSASEVREIPEPTRESTMADPRGDSIDSKTDTTGIKSSEKRVNREIKKISSPIKKVKSTKVDQSVKSVPNRVKTDENSIEKDVNTINTCLQNVHVKMNTKLFNILHHISSNSSLDSDDLSKIEDAMTEKDSANTNDISANSKISEINTKVEMENYFKVVEQSDKLQNENTTEILEGNCSGNRDDSPITIDESPVYTELQNDDMSVVAVNKMVDKLPKSFPEKIPTFDDTIEECDDDEWDYCPGWFEDEIMETYKKGTTFVEPVEDCEEKLETIESCDESGSELSDGIATESSLSLSLKSDTDASNLTNKYRKIGELSTSLSTYPNSTADLSKSLESCYIDYCPTDKESLISREDSESSQDETVDPIERISQNTKLGSLLNEMKKSDLARLEHFFLTSQVSSSDSENSYLRFLPGVVKR